MNLSFSSLVTRPVNFYKIIYATGNVYSIVTIRVANPPGMGGRLPEFNSISRLPPDVAREMIISRNAPSFVLYEGRIFRY